MMYLSQKQSEKHQQIIFSYNNNLRLKTAFSISSCIIIITALIDV